MEESKINGLKYSLSETVRISDPKQQKLYIKHNAYPIDMYTTKNLEKTDDVLIMLFNKKDTKDLYIKWKNRELR